MRQFFILFFCLFLSFQGCNSSAVKDAIDLADGVPRKTIDTTRLGVNAFVNDPQFGSISDQFFEVRDTLGLKFVRVLLGWDDNVQPSPSSAIQFGFADEIMNSIPAGVDVLVVLTGVPSWMSDSANWVGGSPRKTFVERWVKPVASRYGKRKRVIGFEVWNEQNDPMNSDNALLNMLGSENAANYVEMLAEAANVLEELAPGKLVLNGPTTAIAQNFPGTLDYNRAMRDAGLYEFIDIFSIHYYGKQYENLVRPGGVEDFLDSVPKSIWVTESGIQGVNNQLAYGEEVWPFLREKVPSIDRLYIYQFTDGAGSNSFGLVNPDPEFPVSDLYIHLRDRAAQ